MGYQHPNIHYLDRVSCSCNELYYQVDLNTSKSFPRVLNFQPSTIRPPCQDLFQLSTNCLDQVGHLSLSASFEALAIVLQNIYLSIYFLHSKLLLNKKLMYSTSCSTTHAAYSVLHIFFYSRRRFSYHTN